MKPVRPTRPLKHTGRALTIAFGAVLCTATGPPAAQEDPTDTFREEIEVRVVNLEVVVTDEEGRRVTGLPAEAFRVEIQGEQVTIDHFAEISEPSSTAAGTAEAAGSDEASAVNFLVFIDDHVSLARNRDFVLARLRRELPVLGPHDRMAIVAYDGRRLETLSGWSRSNEVLEAAIEKAMERSADGIQWVALGRNPDFVANWIGNATRRSILAATASLRMLPTPAGRKALILVAGSWDPVELAGAGDFSNWCVTGPCSGNYVLTALTDTANLLGYAIYAVDVEGRDVQGSWAREKRLQSTLAAMAYATGGRALLNTERRQTLSIAAADTRSYYSLGFTARGLEADQRQRVEVEVLRPGLSARNRQTFVAVTERRDEDLEVLNALVATGQPEGTPFPVEIGEPRATAPRFMRVPVSVFAPVGKLVWLPDGRRHAARLEVQIASLDSRGNSSEVARYERTLREVTPASAGRLEHFVFDLDLRRRHHSVAVRLRDLNGEAVFSAVAEIAPPGRKRRPARNSGASPAYQRQRRENR